MEIKFGEILDQLIAERGVNQKWLADEANTKEATISRYVNGVNKSPNIEILVNIAKALDVSTDYLLGMSNEKKSKSDLSAEEKILLSAFRRTSERDRTIIWQVLDDYLTPNEKESLQPSTQTAKAE